MRLLGGSAFVLLGLVLSGCQARQPRGFEPVADDLVATFETIDRAVASGDHELATRLLNEIEAATEDSGSLEAVARIRGVLAGSEIAAGLEMWLESRPDPQTPERRDLILLARHADPRNVRIELAASPLVVQRTGVGPRGDHKGTDERLVTQVLKGLDVPPGEQPIEVVALNYEVPMAGLLALREKWRLEPHDGAFRVEDEVIPAVGLSVASVERTMLMAQMSSQAIDAGPLLEMLERPGLLREAGERALPALLERTVRIPASRSAEAFAKVAEKVVEWPDEDLVRITPVLRWLAREDRDVPGPSGWRKRLQSALQPVAKPAVQAKDGLKLR